MLARTLAFALAVATTPALAGGPQGSPSESDDPSKAYPTTPCSGTLSGAVKGSFTCRTDVRPHSGGVHIAFTPEKLPTGVSAFLMGEFQIKGAALATKYTLPTLAKAQVRLSTTDHRTFVALRKDPVKLRGESAAKGEVTYQGDVTLELKPVRKDAHSASASGTLTARLVPSDGSGKGEVTMVLKF